jgi:hypothetical protein
MPEFEFVVDPDCPPGVVYALPSPEAMRWQYGRVQISAELLPFGPSWEERMGRELELDTEFGRDSRHRPDANDARKAERKMCTARRNRETIARLGHPAGAFRRAVDCTQTGRCPLGQTRQFYDRETGNMTCVGCPS